MTWMLGRKRKVRWYVDVAYVALYRHACNDFKETITYCGTRKSLVNGRDTHTDIGKQALDYRFV